MTDVSIRHATKAELTAALTHLAAAPKNSGLVTMLCHRPAPNRRSFPDRLSLSRAEGVAGDRWLTAPWLRLPDGRPDPRIQVSILSSRVLDLVWSNREAVPHPGDPIVADLNLSEENLPEGTLLQAGGAMLRVSAVFNDGCVKWKARYGAAAKDWVVADGHPALRLRGILCAVEADGEIAVGDRIVVMR